jgi:hypothetical protein
MTKSRRFLANRGTAKPSSKGVNQIDFPLENTNFSGPCVQIPFKLEKTKKPDLVAQYSV